MKKNQKLMLIALFLLAVVSIGISYAFWASINLEAEESGEITIGTGLVVEVSASTADVTDGVLVPAGQAEFSLEDDAVEYIIFTFSIVWESNDLDSEATGTLEVDFENVSFGVDNELESYLNLTYQIGGTVVNGVFQADGSNAIEVNGDAVTVYVKVTLTEPVEIEDEITAEEAQEVAEAMFGATATFDVLFTVIED